ncbi:hypothetical protein KUL97_05550 [Synechococcus sp. HK05]|uniref:hypothetical protein n=1 Tax=Synechococcus sp. HK05 TaxID=2725975 RepID=UPI001C39393E|nr:hypothetical protein [Synechococcus sp. HK05]MBV2351174.1 hypothetical protein [Synechococcus sp. HK05]
MTDEQGWHLDPSKFPQKLELELSAEAMEWLRATARGTERTEAELILEILDQALQSRQPNENSSQTSSDAQSS